jgi:hypothetical protein
MVNLKKYMTEENFKLLVDVIKMEGVELLQMRDENLNEEWNSGQTHTNPETLEMFSGNLIDQAKLLKAIKLVENIYGVGKLWSPWREDQTEVRKNAEKIKANYILTDKEWKRKH